MLHIHFFHGQCTLSNLFLIGYSDSHLLSPLQTSEPNLSTSPGSCDSSTTSSIVSTNLRSRLNVLVKFQFYFGFLI